MADTKNDYSDPNQIVIECQQAGADASRYAREAYARGDYATASWMQVAAELHYRTARRMQGVR